MAQTLQHQLQLFLSVDMVGSTAFKQGQEALGSMRGWSAAFKLFYTQVPNALEQELAKTNDAVPLGPRPRFWKAVGDELLFVTELTDYRQALWNTYAWRRAIQASRSVMSQGYPSLDLKSTAWLANFPVPNTVITLPGGIEDFIGPSIDTGFRLAAFASPARLVVSVGLAWFLAEALQDDSARDWGRWLFCYEGPTALKGILGGSPYPLFSLDMRTENDKAGAEDRLSGRVEGKIADIIVVCRETIAERPTHFFAPYIDPVAYPGNEKFNVIPAKHATEMAALRAGQPPVVVEASSSAHAEPKC